MDARTRKIALVVFLLAALFIAPVAAKPPKGKGKGQQYPPAFLEGEQIAIYDVDYTLEADEPCYVIHGFLASWMEKTPEEKLEYVKGEYEFRLYINETEIELTKRIHFYLVYVNPVGVEYTNVLMFSWYVQFEAGYFDPGYTYEFVGKWHRPEKVVTRISIVTFT